VVRSVQGDRGSGAAARWRRAEGFPGLVRDPDVAKAPAVSTIWRILTRRGFVVPPTHKRPRSAWKRFTADQPNQLWQADVTTSKKPTTTVD
jgi:transposase InsO family protein